MVRLHLLALRWAIEFRYRAASLWQAFSTSKWFHRLFQAISICLCIYWYIKPPIPNKAVLAIGVVAVIMTLTEMRPSHKAGWLVIVFVLAFLENRSINQERKTSESERAQTRQEENSQFQKIADGITGAIKQSQQQFEATTTENRILLQSTTQSAQLAEHSLEVLTGGKSYPQIVITFSSNHPPIGLIAEINRTRNVGEFTYAVDQTDEKCPFSGNAKFLGISGRTGPILNMIRLPDTLNPSPTGVTHYQIRMEAKNGFFIQCLDVRPDMEAHGWNSKSTIMLRQFLGGIGILVEKWKSPAVEIINDDK